jgi:hypothetical protein
MNDKHSVGRDAATVHEALRSRLRRLLDILGRLTSDMSCEREGYGEGAKLSAAIAQDRPLPLRIKNRVEKQKPPLEKTKAPYSEEARGHG